MELTCGENCCRKKLTPHDFDLYYKAWDEKIKLSLKKIYSVDQPLISLLDESAQIGVSSFIKDPRRYKSVYSLKYHKVNKLNGHNKVLV